MSDHDDSAEDFEAEVIAMLRRRATDVDIVATTRLGDVSGVGGAGEVATRQRRHLLVGALAACVIVASSLLALVSLRADNDVTSVVSQPEIPASTTPAAAQTSAVIVEAGSDCDPTEQSGALVEASCRRSGTTYVVVAGDTLGQLAETFGVGIDSILEANPALRSESLEVGDELVVPPNAVAATGCPSGFPVASDTTGDGVIDTCYEDVGSGAPAAVVSVSGPGTEWASAQTTSYVFDTDLATWVSFADAVVTFQIVEVSEGLRQENITGTVAIQQFLTLDVQKVVWTSPNSSREIPTSVVVQGSGLKLLDDQIFSVEPSQVVSDQVFVGAIAYSTASDMWFEMSNSVARVDSEGKVQTSGLEVSTYALDELESVLAETKPYAVDFSIADPIERSYVYYDALALAAEKAEPAPTPDPNFVKPCPVDADEIPQEILDECEARIAEAED